MTDSEADLGTDLQGQSRKMITFRAAVGGRTWKTVQVMVSLGLIALLLTSINCADVVDAARLAGSRTLFFAFGLILFAHVVSAIRLHLLLDCQKIGIGFAKAVQLTFAGLFAGNFLPSTVGGDAARILGLTRAGLCKETAMASVAMDRMMSLTAMLLMLPTALLAPRLLSSQGRIGVVLAFCLGLILTALFLILIFFVASKKENGILRRGWTSWLWSWLQGSSLQFRVCLHCLKADPAVAVTSMGLSWIFFLAAILAVWFLAMDVGVQASYLEMIAAVTIAYFVSLIPISLNGLGIQEASLVLLLGNLGAGPSQALALAAIVRILHISSSLIGAWALIGIGEMRTPNVDKRS